MAVDSAFASCHLSIAVYCPRKFAGSVCRGERLTRRGVLKDIAADFSFSDCGAPEYTAGSADSIPSRRNSRRGGKGIGNIMDKRESDFYQQLRKRLRAWMQKGGSKHKYSEYLLFAPDLFHLLCKLSVERRVPVAEKAKLAAAIAYFISPIDLIPEAIVGPAGYVDDIALAAYVLNSIVNTTDPEVVRSHWAGDGDVLDLIQQILQVADDMVGSGLWKKLFGLVGGRPKAARQKRASASAKRR
jgi:uncharacterized membrane protein YkvA (DUF1232 family)